MIATARSGGTPPIPGMTIFDVEAIDLVELAEATGDGEDALGEILRAGASEEARLWNWLDGARSIVDIQDVLAHAQGAFPRIEEAAQWLIGVMLLPALKTVYTSEAAVEVYLRTPDGSPIETLALLKIIALSQTRGDVGSLRSHLPPECGEGGGPAEASRVLFEGRGVDCLAPRVRTCWP